MTQSLETPRLLLRQFRESDWDAYAQMSADAEVMRYIGTGVTLTRDESWRSIANFLGHWQLRGYGMYAIESKESGEFVGRVGIHDPPGCCTKSTGREAHSKKTKTSGRRSEHPCRCHARPPRSTRCSLLAPATELSAIPASNVTSRQPCATAVDRRVASVDCALRVAFQRTALLQGAGISR